MQRWQGFSRLNDSGEPAPSCTVKVYGKGTSSLSLIYSANDAALPAANPGTAGTDGFYKFYAANGRYDVEFSGGGIGTAWSYGDIMLYDPGTLGS